MPHDRLYTVDIDKDTPHLTPEPSDGDALVYDSVTGWTPTAGGGGGAPTTVDYLVGTASGGLSAEIVVGTTPGGELGGTWASPTVDATHSGSTHSTATDAHIADTSDAHDASAISLADANGNTSETDVEGAIDELYGLIGGTGIPDTIVDAKGDLIAATAADTVARLPVGANDFALIAASGETTGLKWGPVAASWTPALTAVSSNPTLGSGAVTQGNYIRIGDLVIAWGVITFGTSGEAAGSGNYRISLPVTMRASSNADAEVVGHGIIFDSSAPATRGVTYRYVSQTTAGIFIVDGSATVANNSPWTWAASDSIRFALMYEAD